MEWLDIGVLGATAFTAALVGSVAGSGGTAVLMPVMVLYYGVREAIPILTIVNLVANGSRVLLNRREIVLPVVGWFVLGAVPATIAGAVLFTMAPAPLLTRLLGGFLLLILLWRRLSPRPPSLVRTALFAPLGAVFGLLSGLLEGVGPLMAPFFLAHGLLRGAYIGTDALASVTMHISKLAVFGNTEMLGTRVLTVGLTLAPFMFLGTFVGKLVVNRLPERIFVILIELTLLIAGTAFLVWGA